MATKKISELTKIDSIRDTDLFIVETYDGTTKAIEKSNIISETEKKQITIMQNDISTMQGNIQSVQGDISTMQTEIENIQQQIEDGVSSLSFVNIQLLTGWTTVADDLYSKTITNENITSQVIADQTALDCYTDINTKRAMKENGINELWIENQNGRPIIYAYGSKPTIEMAIQVRIINQ